MIDWCRYMKANQVRECVVLNSRSRDFGSKVEVQVQLELNWNRGAGESSGLDVFEWGGGFCLCFG